MNDDVRDLIMNNASTDQLRVAARRSGMMSLREAGLRAIYEGSTTIDEVVRETVVEEEAQ
jgi:type IV pilus assembly protein PilB